MIRCHEYFRVDTVVDERSELDLQKRYLLTSAPSKDFDQPARSRSLIKIFTIRILDSQGCNLDANTDAKADLSLR